MAKHARSVHKKGGVIKSPKKGKSKHSDKPKAKPARSKHRKRG